MKLKAILVVVAAMVLTAASCDKNRQDDYIPLVNVNLALHINDPAYINLSVVGGWEMVNGGSRGLVIYRRNNDEFMAFDRHCPYQADDGCAVAVDSTNVGAIDTCCNSRFLIIDGSVANGPAARPLKAYQTTFDGTVLHIFN